MEHGFYAERMKSHGIEVMVPDAAGRTLTHNIIFDELCAGKVLSPSRKALIDLIDTAEAEGADAVILGCTEICLILDPKSLPLPGLRLHRDPRRRRRRIRPRRRGFAPRRISQDRAFPDPHRLQTKMASSPRLWAIFR